MKYWCVLHYLITSSRDRVDIHATEVGTVSIPLADLHDDYQDEIETVPDNQKSHTPNDKEKKSHRGKGKNDFFRTRRRNRKNLRKKNKDYFAKL